MQAHYEIVTTDAGHHVRLRAANGEPVLTSEVLDDEASAERVVMIARLEASAIVERVDERTAKS